MKNSALNKIDGGKFLLPSEPHAQIKYEYLNENIRVGEKQMGFYGALSVAMVQFIQEIDRAKRFDPEGEYRVDVRKARQIAIAEQAQAVVMTQFGEVEAAIQSFVRWAEHDLNEAARLKRKELATEPESEIGQLMALLKQQEARSQFVTLDQAAKVKTLNGWVAAGKYEFLEAIASSPIDISGNPAMIAAAQARAKEEFMNNLPEKAKYDSKMAYAETAKTSLFLARKKVEAVVKQVAEKMMPA